MTSLFISDLHLSLQRPEKLALFERLLEGPARKAEVLYILGDLFDGFWIGCDDQRPPNPQIMTILKDYAHAGNAKLFIMRGNRDFHLNEKFSAITGAQIIDDPHLITLDDKQVLLMHGDTLCTDDVKYQYWRKFITHPVIKFIYSIFPLALRKRIASNVREYASEAVKKKPSDIIDVSTQAVVETMKKHNVTLLIHGHTHRQAVHNVNLDGVIGKRVVLGDWYEQDCILVYDDIGFRFERVEDYLDKNNK